MKLNGVNILCYQEDSFNEFQWRDPCKVQAVIDVNFDGRRTDAIRQTAAFANYVKQVEQVMSETHE